jgi:hypothetical protein
MQLQINTHLSAEYVIVHPLYHLNKKKTKTEGTGRHDEKYENKGSTGLCSSFFDDLLYPRGATESDGKMEKKELETDRLPPPRTLILDFTMTHTRYDRSLSNLNGQLTNTRRSDGAPEPDGDIKTVDRKKILHYRQLYVDRPDPIAFMPVTLDTSGRIYDDFLRLLFLHAHRETSALENDIPSFPLLV